MPSIPIARIPPSHTGGPDLWRLNLRYTEGEELIVFADTLSGALARLTKLVTQKEADEARRQDAERGRR